MKIAAFAAIAGIVTATTCFDVIAQDKSSSCPPPPYPKKALDSEQSGMVEAGFLIGPDGMAQDSFVATSSGVRDLDRATVQGLGKCRFTPALVDGQPVTRWQHVLYTWELDPPGRVNPEFLRAAEAGPPAAQYLLALMYLKGFRVDKDEQTSRRWLQVAAERGYAMAQFKVGLAYETGAGVAQDDTQAANWYRKAAAKGNTFAREKLHFGFGSIAAVPEAKN